MPAPLDPVGVALVVEDEWLMRQLMVDLLNERGWHVLEAASGDEALAHISNGGGAADVLLTDIRLRGEMTGWDVAEKFREHDPEIGVIYLTGNAVQPARQVAGSLFFTKPCDPETILDACDSVLTA